MILREVPPPAFAAPPVVQAGIGLAPPRPWPLENHPAFLTPIFADWALVTCYFNPAGHARPVHNLAALLDWCFGVRAPIFVAELSFHDQVRMLPRSDRVRHFRLGEEGVMFQKEALLSAMVEGLPKRVTKVFLIDADVVPDEPDVYCCAALELDRLEMVQPFSDAVWCDRTGAPESRKKGMAWAAVFGDPKPNALDPAAFHPGFAVGLRRDFFDRVGRLYGCPITGTGDVALWQSALAPHAAAPAPGRTHYSAPAPQEYREKVAAWCGGRVGFVSGQMRHFWHGSRQARAYDARHRLLQDFRPHVHLGTDARSGLPVWTEAGRPFMAAMRSYFASRGEDV